MSKSHILIVDGMNFLHRSRAGFQFGPAPVVYNFMRSFRSLIEQFNPDKVYFVLEGHPQQRKQLFQEYKENRIVEVGTAKHEELEKFFKQVNVIIEHLSENFPLIVIKHPYYECDDTIYNLIKRSDSQLTTWTVVSNDSDFTQLLNQFDNVRLYNPMMKSFVEKTDYDYVSWKALRGDASDNIPGIPGVGDKSAEKYLNDPDELVKLLEKSNNAEIFDRNLNLIQFIEWSDEETEQVVRSSPTYDWEPLRKLFNEYQFKSLINDKSWNKFVDTFKVLWENRNKS